MEGRNLWGIFGGVLLIAMGIIFMLGQFMSANIWGFAWPFFIIAVGAMFFAGMVAGGRSTGALAIPGSMITAIGLILFIQNLFDLWATWAYAWALIIVAVGIGLYIFSVWSSIPDLRLVSRIVMIAGLIAFIIFGLVFELGAALFGLRSPGGVFWAVALILLGLYFLFGRALLHRRSGPVSRSVVSFPSEPAAGSTGATAQAEATASEAAATAAAAGAAAVTAAAEGEPTGVRRVRFRSIGDLTIVQGEREGLEIEASEAIKERIRVETTGDTLEIRIDQDWWDWMNPLYWNPGPVRYSLSVRDLVYLDASGLGNTYVPDLTTRRLELLHSGAGNVTVRRLSVDELAARQAGVGNIEIEGQAGRQEVELTGAGSYDAGRLQSRSAQVRITGVGNATVWATEQLDARVSGTGNIDYYGSPQVTQSVSGLGNVRRLGER